MNNFKVGDRVFGSSQLRLGAYGEYLSLPDDYTIASIPDNLSFEEAAAVPLGGLNALHFLSRARIQPGERILINGAGGSIGIYGIQIAQSMGAQVTAVDAPHKGELLRDLGVDRFIDYNQQSFWEDGERYDLMMSVETQMDELIEYIQTMAYTIGGPYRAPGIKAEAFRRIADKIHKVR